MGQNLRLPRYPIHWQRGWDSKVQYTLRNAAIHDTYKRDAVTGARGTNTCRLRTT